MIHFTLKFMNIKTRTNVLYSTKNLEFVHTPYYMKTTVNINNNGKIFGLGERVGDFFSKDGIYTIWARDELSPVEDGNKPGKNIYGAHPIFFSKLKSGNDFFAVFENNAGAQDYIFRNNSKTVVKSLLTSKPQE